MFQGHPKGLYVLFFSNMGERFGYYTMLAIFTLYLRDHFGWSDSTASAIYGYFLGAVYFMPLFGGLLADKVLGYGKTIILGFFIMMTGYALLAIPTANPYAVYGALAVIAIGVGLFKGNLAVILGNLYNKESMSGLKDAAFNIFYMGINIGAFFAPHAAGNIRNYLLAKEGFTYQSNIPQLAHEFVSKTQNVDFTPLQQFAQTCGIPDVPTFCDKYLACLANGYNAGFFIASIAMIISLVIFLVFRGAYKEGDYTSKDKVKPQQDIELTPAQVKDRIFALVAIFIIVVFFWLAFHQNGASLTFFAKNYTQLSVTNKFTYMLFDIRALSCLFVVILGLIAAIHKGAAVWRSLGVLFALAGGAGIYYIYSKLGDVSGITPELFQAFNPIFIVFMTPIVVTFFAWLNSHKKEPSAPGKIGIGMFVTAIGFSVMLLASLGLPSVSEIGGKTSPILVSPYWLISTYFVLTIAELFLSPMGLSFVSKVSPPNMRGLMQGGWLAATGLGNLLAGQVGRFYENWQLWQFFLLLVVTSLISSILAAIVLKKIKQAISS